MINSKFLDVNLQSRMLFDIAKFLIRDFSEVSFIKDLEKRKSFVKQSIERNKEFLLKALLQSNLNYGVLNSSGKKIRESKNNLYWLVKPVDSLENFAAAFPFWGSLIILVQEESEKFELESATFYLPMFDQLFYAKLNNGAFFGNKKINLSQKTKVDINLGFNGNKILGSDILHSFYYLAYADSLAIKDNFLNKLLLKFLLQEAKASYSVKNDLLISTCF